MEKLKEGLSEDVFRRRQFLAYTGAGLAVAALSMAGCDKDKEKLPSEEEAVYLGSGDIAILNYAYVLEQLEADFYTQVVERPYGGISELERIFLTEIRDHEIAHREFFKTFNSEHIIPSVEIDLTSINFDDRMSVLEAAKSLEDLSVAAYNGLARLIEQGTNLLLIGKIASVEARHAAWIRDAISNGTFADGTVIDENGLDTVKSPTKVLEAISMYIVTELDARDLPTY